MTAVKELPRLREDLVLLNGASDGAGRPSWLVHDPMQHRFIQIDATTFRVLSLWRQCKTVEQLVQGVGSPNDAALSESEIGKLVEFLDQHHLLQDLRKSWRDLARTGSAHKKGLLHWLAHNYLFMKIPLVRCDGFLARTEPALAALVSRGLGGFLLICGITGFYLASRQWEQLLLAVQSLTSFQGAVGLAVALFVVKTLHELGHAYVATHFGCRVPTIGLAVVMMAPMLYTDVTDAWRLRDRRQRLAIDAAGVGVELAIACMATLAWAILPDGLPRVIALLLATTSIVMSLVINLNPFMRFDGYYMLADAVGIDNLQPRAFRVGSWWTREMLFAVGQACPEQLDKRVVRWLVVYAWTTWIVRLSTYLGIAVLVYAYFFKALGIVMFAFEIWFFVMRPLSNEAAAWWKMRDRIMVGKRVYGTGTIAALALMLFAVPWSTTVHVPAVLEARHVAHVYSPRPARIRSLLVRPGQRVDAGTVLAVLDVPDLDFEESTHRARLRAVTLRLDRLSADALDRDDRIVLDSEQAALAMRLQGIGRQRAELEIKAPMAGTIAELDPNLHAGRWVTTKEQLALIVGGKESLVRGYADEADVGRIVPGARGRFIPDDPQVASTDVTLRTVAVSGVAALELMELAASNGGRIVAQANARQALVPASAQYLVEFDVPGLAGIPAMKQRGLVHVRGTAESMLARTWRRVLRILIQESGA